MKIDKVKDIDQLFEVVDGCDGGVTLVTTEGDRLNIKSKLTQYLIYLRRVLALERWSCWSINLRMRQNLKHILTVRVTS